MEAGKLELLEAMFPLFDAISSTLKSMAMTAHDKGIQLALDLNPNLPLRVFGDAAKLRQVLCNLISNAIK